VIHYDPWWNPATENQATDRAYRIGQEKPVFVYKMIARGTVEEKIQHLQKEKSDSGGRRAGRTQGRGLEAAE
jgi:SNF2 family DNA or RNA helicase